MKIRILLITIFTSLLLLSSQILLALKTKTVNGTASIRVESHMSEEQAKDKVLFEAIINALENEFGSYTEQTTETEIKDGKANFLILGDTKVKGEWVKTVEEKFNKDVRKDENGDYEIWITCKVKGKAREILPKAALEIEVLNLADKKARTNVFDDGEQLYLWFKSPVSGYLAVFVEVGDMTYRILPYSSMDGLYESGVPVAADEEYIFFAEGENHFQNYLVDEILLETDLEKEHNTVYVIFSEDKFIKPGLKQIEIVNEEIIPKSLKTSEFKKWLSDCRLSINSFQDIKLGITIKK